MRVKRTEADKEQEEAKESIRQRVLNDHEAKAQKLERDHQRLRDDLKKEVDRYEQDLQRSSKDQQSALEQHLRLEFDREKAAF